MPHIPHPHPRVFESSGGGTRDHRMAVCFARVGPAHLEQSVLPVRTVAPQCAASSLRETIHRGVGYGTACLCRVETLCMHTSARLMSGASRMFVPAVNTHRLACSEGLTRLRPSLLPALCERVVHPTSWTDLCTRAVPHLSNPVPREAAIVRSGRSVHIRNSARVERTWTCRVSWIVRLTVTSTRVDRSYDYS